MLGRLCYLPVRHDPWRLQHAAVTALHDELAAAVDLPVGDVERVHYAAAAQDVRFPDPCGPSPAEGQLCPTVYEVMGSDVSA